MGGHHGRSHCCPQKNIAARLKFAKEHLDVPQRYWQNILWTDETKVVFGRNTQHYVWRKKGTAHNAQWLRRILAGLLKTSLESLEHANISVDDSTIRKALNKNGVHGRAPRKKPLPSKKNIAERRFQKCTWMFQNILWTD